MIRAGTRGFVIEAGVMADYHALARFHYRAGRPATVSRIWRIRDVEPTVSERFLRTPPRDWRGTVIGVLIESFPMLNCRARELALGGRYGAIGNVKERAMLLRDEVRCISRVIIDPRVRGLGLAVGLVRHALEQAVTAYTEALAVMGAVHPMFERAGMRAYRPCPAGDDARTPARSSAGRGRVRCRPVYYLHHRRWLNDHGPGDHEDEPNQAPADHR